MAGDTGTLCRLNIPIAVTDHQAFCGVQAKAMHRLLDHEGFGFTAEAGFGTGMVRAGINRIKTDAVGGQCIQHFGMDSV
jgi:hypothetical protein